jgi:hypothetical protein
MLARLFTDESADLAHAIYTLATKSIRLSMAVSWELFQLLNQLQQQLQGCSATGILVANAALELLDNGETVLCCCMAAGRPVYARAGNCWEVFAAPSCKERCCCWAT